MPRIITLVATLALLLPLQGHAADAPTDERTATYRDYRDAFESGDYARALPLAVRVAELTRNQFGPDALELANPLTNVATTLYRMREYGEALDTYRRALTILDLAGNSTDQRLIAPLHGIGLTLRAMARDEESIVPLKRAVDIIRNRDGLHAQTQLPILRALIGAFEKAGRNADAAREHLYAFNVAEQNYGREDPRMIPVLGELAGWYEKNGRYSAARVLHMRAVQLADRESANSLKAVEGLRGIARTYRLAFVNGESYDVAVNSVGELPPSVAQSAMMPPGAQASGEGERALRNALLRLEPSGRAKAAERGAVLLDLGDWYRIAGTGQRAMTTWAEAWREFSRAGDTSAMEKPAPIVYRAPNVAVSQRQQNPAEYSEQVVQVRVSIAADGGLREATVANPSAERDSAERAVVTALRRATWRPAFAGGLPVATPDFVYSEPVYIRRLDEKPAG